MLVDLCVSVCEFVCVCCKLNTRIYHVEGKNSEVNADVEESRCVETISGFSCLLSHQNMVILATFWNFLLPSLPCLSNSINTCSAA